MKLGILGVGNMGGAILRGYSKVADSDVFIYDADEIKLDEAAELPGVVAVDSLDELMTSSDAVILALKPNIFDIVMPQIADIAVKCDNPKVVVSIAAGISIQYLQQFLGPESKVVRVMPNTPAMVGEGMSALSASSSLSEEEMNSVLKVFEVLGKAEIVDESLMDVVTGISGSSPAYAYMYIQGLMECGIKNGMTPEMAKTFAAQATLGAAKMVLENDISPEQLRINVCSPGGTTIEAVESLNSNDFISNVGEAMDAAIEKSKVMTK